MSAWPDIVGLSPDVGKVVEGATRLSVTAVNVAPRGMKHAVLDGMDTRRVGSVVAVLFSTLVPVLVSAACGGQIDASELTPDPPLTTTPDPKKPQKTPLPAQEETPANEPAGVCPAAIAFVPSQYDALIGGSYRSPMPPTLSLIHI